MKERPILFKAEMVRAILDGRKTQTRRAVKPQPVGADDAEALEAIANGKQGWSSIKTLHFLVGDRLWVRETFAKPEYVRQTIYRADCDTELYEDEDCERLVKWKPSIFMRRHQSRITLEIVSVRVERLQDITDGDAFNEGVGTAVERISTHFPGKWINEFRTLWDSINAKSHPWDSNPWVWVIEFKKV